MKKEIKKLEDLRIQANYNRLGRIEQIILEAIINNKYIVHIKDHLINEFVLEKLKKSGYIVEVIEEAVDFPDVHHPRKIHIIKL